MKKKVLLLLLAGALVCIVTGCSTTASDPAAKTDNGVPSYGTAPTVTLNMLDGQSLPLSSFRGKVVLVNFWATWCEPCRAEIPELIQFQDKYGSKGFTVLGVAMDQEGKSVVAPFVAKPQWPVDGRNVAMNYPIVLGNDDVATKFGGLLGTPTSFLISKDGKIVMKTIGVIDDQTVNQLIQKLL